MHCAVFSKAIVMCITLPDELFRVELRT